MNRYGKFLSLSATLLIFASCGNNKTENQVTTSIRGVDKSFLDTTVKPGDDFYTYANNGWLKKTEIPATEGIWGIFSVLKDEVNDKLKNIAEEAASAKSPAKGSNQQLVGDFFASGMDSVKAEQLGISPLTPVLDKIKAIKDKKELAAMNAELHSHFVFSMFTMYVGQDARHSDRMVPSFSQGGLGLPDRDYYTRQDDDSKQIRAKYLEHLKNLLTLMGEKEADVAKEADAILKLETSLATISWTNVENRDPLKTYNKRSIADLGKMCPSFNWSEFLGKVGITNVDSVVVAQPSFYTGLEKVISSTPLDAWKIYMQVGVVDNNSPYLGSKFEKESFDFYDKTLSGVTEMKPRWKRVLGALDHYVGEPMGQLFVEKYFTAEAKKRVNDMVDNLIAAYKERITKLDWMSDSTKMQAQQKLDKIMRKLGYPDKWKDYTTLDVSRDSYAKNAWNASEFGYKLMIGKLGKPVDRTEWGMTPPTINAYYNPSMNEIVFPAGIMQFPFFDVNQDDAMNYGAMGAVIGHELTHGFDDQGSHFNSEGNMMNWWTKTDHEKFEEKTGRLVREFSNFTAIDTLHVNGKLTLGENIADLGGLTIAYYAYKRSQQGKEPQTIDGFTPEQRFFLGWARGWCVKFRPEALKKQVLTNEHAPGMFRVLGPLSNMQEFYDAWHIKEGDKMYRSPDERVVIW